MTPPPHHPKRIVFLHPDLGIGGAERLVLDAALALQSLGHTVTIFTSHRDPAHCFDEARDGTLDVRVRGHSLFPATVLGRFKILLSILRQLHLIVSVAWSGELGGPPDAFFVDQLAAGIPLLRWRWEGARVLFYCHFPDLLLVKGRERWWRRVWRVGFDWVEGWGMRGADRVVVNSGFTKGVVEKLWPALAGKKEEEGEIAVVYPCVNTREEKEEKTRGEVGPKKEGGGLWKGKRVVLSINRFERKKNIELVIRAFRGLEEVERKRARLVVAGGYDLRVEENVGYHQELVTLAEKLGLRTATMKNMVTALNIPDDIEVLFLLSVPSQLKSMLLSAARLLVYTPTDEHFGIVPLEAMLARVPVLAANSGGPLETVLEGKTGWLRPAEDESEWTEVIQRVLFRMRDGDLKKIGEAGESWVKREFSETKLAERLDEEIESMIQLPRKRTIEIPDVLLGVGFSTMVLTAMVAVAIRIIR